VTTVNAVQVAPPGFTAEEWETFMRDGLVVLQTRLGQEEIDRYLEAAERCLSMGPAYSAQKTHKVSNVVASDPVFTELIDHPRHVGYAHDLFGEQLKLLQAELFHRPPGSFQNEWHIDGPRLVPYKTFAASVPVKVRVAYWLTDLPHADMGNLVYLPGSHLDAFSEYAGRDTLPGERPFCCERGTICVFNGNIWHRVSANRGSTPRVNLFITYSPSWITGYHVQDPAWAATLTRERRIILRPYDGTLKSFTRPPAEDVPLYLDRDTRDEHGPLVAPVEERHKWRRLTAHEKRVYERGSG
jgi:Phytanoyl-CoA dioxygenase (PhyH)